MTPIDQVEQFIRSNNPLEREKIQRGRRRLLGFWKKLFSDLYPSDNVQEHLCWVGSPNSLPLVASKKNSKKNWQMVGLSALAIVPQRNLPPGMSDALAEWSGPDMGPRSYYMTLGHLAVHRQAQGNKVGSTLLDATISLAKTIAARQAIPGLLPLIFLQVKDDAPSKNLYESRKFETVPKFVIKVARGTAGTPSTNLVLMAKPLP